MKKFTVISFALVYVFTVSLLFSALSQKDVYGMILHACMLIEITLITVGSLIMSKIK